MTTKKKIVLGAIVFTLCIAKYCYNNVGYYKVPCVMLNIKNQSVSLSMEARDGFSIRHFVSWFYRRKTAIQYASSPPLTLREPFYVVAIVEKETKCYVISENTSRGGYRIDVANLGGRWKEISREEFLRSVDFREVFPNVHSQVAFMDFINDADARRFDAARIIEWLRGKPDDVFHASLESLLSTQDLQAYEARMDEMIKIYKIAKASPR